MEHLIFVLFLLATAAIFASLEIQIEGHNGWASALPSWRIHNRWTRLLLGSRPLTGYHFYTHLFITALLHAPFALALVPFSWAAELRILAFFILLWLVEDFFWFVLNPRYGIRRFSAANVPWHAATWWGFMPREYWIFLPLGIGLYAASWAI